MKNDLILIVLESEQSALQMKTFVQTELQQYHIEAMIADDAMDGLMKFRQYSPCLVIISSELQPLNGYSFSSIVKGTRTGEQCCVFMVIDGMPIPNSKVDYYIVKPLKQELLALQLQSFFEKRNMALFHQDEITRAKHKQNQLLPKELSTDAFKVDYIYSPFSDLSGDCLDYWHGESQIGLYGFLFDCTGHDICSFLQVSEVRTIFRWGFRYYQTGLYKSLAEIMENVNIELFNSHGDNVSCVAAIAFYLDFQSNTLRYCSAGIPTFYTRATGATEYSQVEMSNYLIGYEPDADFEESQLSLDGIDEVIFSSDGFSELLFKKANHLQNPKHDDVSAIFIHLKRN